MSVVAGNPEDICDVHFDDKAIVIQDAGVARVSHHALEQSGTVRHTSQRPRPQNFGIERTLAKYLMPGRVLIDALRARSGVAAGARTPQIAGDAIAVSARARVQIVELINVSLRWPRDCRPARTL
jgi:hypothetical protein